MHDIEGEKKINNKNDKKNYVIDIPMDHAKEKKMKERKWWRKKNKCVRYMV